MYPVEPCRYWHCQSRAKPQVQIPDKETKSLQIDLRTLVDHTAGRTLFQAFDLGHSAGVV